MVSRTRLLTAGGASRSGKGDRKYTSLPGQTFDRQGKMGDLRTGCRSWSCNAGNYEVSGVSPSRGGEPAYFQLDRGAPKPIVARIAQTKDVSVLLNGDRFNVEVDD